MHQTALGSLQFINQYDVKGSYVIYTSIAHSSLTTCGVAVIKLGFQTDLIKHEKEYRAAEKVMQGAMPLKPFQRIPTPAHSNNKYSCASGASAAEGREHLAYTCPVHSCCMIQHPP